MPPAVRGAHPLISVSSTAPSSSGLGHRPLKAATAVQIRSGLRGFWQVKGLIARVSDQALDHFSLLRHRVQPSSTGNRRHRIGLIGIPAGGVPGPDEHGGDRGGGAFCQPGSGQGWFCWTSPTRAAAFCVRHSAVPGILATAWQRRWARAVRLVWRHESGGLLAAAMEPISALVTIGIVIINGPQEPLRATPMWESVARAFTDKPGKASSQGRHFQISGSSLAATSEDAWPLYPGYAPLTILDQKKTEPSMASHMFTFNS